MCRLLNSSLWLWLLRRSFSRLSRLGRSLVLSLSLDLFLVGGDRAHSQLGDILLGRHAMLRRFGVQLFALLFGELLWGHSSLCGLSSELLLHCGELLGGWPTWRRHCDLEL